MAVSEGRDDFLDQWQKLSQSEKSTEDRGLAYLSLANSLKEKPSTAFLASLATHQRPLTQIVLGDISGEACDHAALHLFGYCLHQPQFTSGFSVEEASEAIKVLCDVISNEATSRNTCTRALWCLANQSFQQDLLRPSVPLITEVVSRIVMLRRYDTPILDAEALNIFIRLQGTCQDKFITTATFWYKAIVQLFFSKFFKMQRKALDLALSFEKRLRANHEVSLWLAKELKEHLLADLVQLLGSKGQGHSIALSVWSHFVSVLGKVLHKHGSFVNELLRVVELGFKHRTSTVQVAAYGAWKSLVNNFATDVSVITSQKRLKLLLMPLLASAVKDNHEEVDNVRLQTWWHFISCLGDQKANLFKQICIPFLLFCLGVDPKSDLSNLSASMLSLQPLPSSPSKIANLTSESSKPTKKENQPLTVPPTLEVPSSEASGCATPPPSSELGALFLSLACTSPNRTGGVKGKRSSERYHGTARLPAVLSACQAMLLFLGMDQKVSGCPISGDCASYVVFPQGIVPPDVAEFFVLFLDALSYYCSQYESEMKGNVAVRKLTHTIFFDTLCTLNEVAIDVKIAGSLLLALLRLFRCPQLIDHSDEVTALPIISHLCSISERFWPFVNSGTQVYWKVLLELIFNCEKAGREADYGGTFVCCFEKVITMATTSKGCLSAYLVIMRRLEAFLSSVETRAGGARLWITLSRRFITHIKKTSEINHGTMLDLDFTASQLILKIPFLYFLHTIERVCAMAALDVWKELYDVVNIHACLYVKDSNVCAEMVSNDLYAAYGQNARTSTFSLDRSMVIKFDSYQNSVALALQFIASKINWNFIRGQFMTRRVGAESDEEKKYKRIQPLISLLSWQLASLWDITRHASVQLGQLHTPYTLMDTLNFLFSNFPSTHVMLSAAELLAEPLANVWDTILTSEPLTSRQRVKSAAGRNLHEIVIVLWKVLTTCFQLRYQHPFSSTLLSVLSPLLTVTITSRRQPMISQTLLFWAATFGKTKYLDYPPKFRDALSQYLKDASSTVPIRLPGFHQEKEVLSVEDSLPTLGESVAAVQADTVESSELAETPAEDDANIVLPNPSPRKGVMGSFLNRVQSPKRTPMSTPVKRSPAAKSIDDILERSRERREKTGLDESAPLPRSARRKLPLGDEAMSGEEFVASAPPPAKRRLLTEHQKERLRETSDIPALYNALDPSQDASNLPLSVSQSIPESLMEEDPIVISDDESGPSDVTVVPLLSTVSASSSDATGSVIATTALSATSSTLPESPPSHHGCLPSHLEDFVPPQSCVASVSTLPTMPPLSSATAVQEYDLCPTSVSSRAKPALISLSVEPTLSHSSSTMAYTSSSNDILTVMPAEVGLTILATSPMDTTLVTSLSMPDRVVTCSHTAPPKLISTLSQGISSRRGNGKQQTVSSAAAVDLVTSPSTQQPACLSSSIVPTTLMQQLLVNTPQTSYSQAQITATPLGMRPGLPHCGLLEPRQGHSGVPVADILQRPRLPVRFPIASAPKPQVLVTLPHFPPTGSASPTDVGLEQLIHNYRTTMEKNSKLLKHPAHHQAQQRIQLQHEQIQKHIQQLTQQHPPQHHLTHQQHQQFQQQVQQLAHQQLAQYQAQMSQQQQVTRHQLVQPPQLALSQQQAQQQIVQQQQHHVLVRQQLAQQQLAQQQLAEQQLAEQQLAEQRLAEQQEQQKLQYQQGYSVAQSKEYQRHPTPAALSMAVAQPPPLTRSMVEMPAVQQPGDKPIAVEATPIALLAVNKPDQTEHFVVLRHQPVSLEQPSHPPLLTTEVQGTESGSQGLPGNVSVSNSNEVSVSNLLDFWSSHQKTASISTDLEGLGGNESGLDKTTQPKASRPSHGSTPAYHSQRKGTPSFKLIKHCPELVSPSADNHPKLAIVAKPSVMGVRKPRKSVSNQRGGKMSTRRSSGAQKEVSGPRASVAKPVQAHQHGLELEDPLSNLSSVAPVSTPSLSPTFWSDEPFSVSVGSVASAVGLAAVTEKAQQSTRTSSSSTSLPSRNDNQILPACFVTTSNEMSTTALERRAALDSDRVSLSSVHALSTASLSQIENIPTCGPHADEPTSQATAVASELGRLETVKLPDPDSTGGQSTTSIIAPASESGGEASPVFSSKDDLDAGEFASLPTAEKMTPTHSNESIQDDAADTSPKATPAGILKHISQFDTPSSSSRGRKVQFARGPPMQHQLPEEQFKTPKQSRDSRASSGGFSSRRTLQMSQPAPRMGLVKSPSTPSKAPVYPALADCSSPIEQIVPGLSQASNFTHGLLNLVRARNIHTVGNMSSLSEEEIETLPIKSPKVETLRNTLRNFEQQLKSATGAKRRSSVDCEHQPPSKVRRIDFIQADDGVSTEEDSLADSFTQPVSPPSAVTLSAPDSQISDSLVSKVSEDSVEASTEEGAKTAETGEDGGDGGGGDRGDHGEEASRENGDGEEVGGEEEEEETERDRLGSGEAVEEGGDAGGDHVKDGSDDKMEASAYMEEVNTVEGEMGGELATKGQGIDTEFVSGPGIGLKAGSLDVSTSEAISDHQPSISANMLADSMVGSSGIEYEAQASCTHRDAMETEHSLIEGSLITEHAVQSSSILRDETVARHSQPVATSVSLDHPYCSQEQASGISTSQTTLNLNVAVSSGTVILPAFISKLSSASCDHTYCSSGLAALGDSSLGRESTSDTGGPLCSHLTTSSSSSITSAGLLVSHMEVLASGVAEGVENLSDTALSQDLFSIVEASVVAPLQCDAPADGVAMEPAHAVSADVGIELDSSGSAVEELPLEENQMLSNITTDEENELALSSINISTANTSHQTTPQNEISSLSTDFYNSLDQLISAYDTQRAAVCDAIQAAVHSGASPRDCARLLGSMLSMQERSSADMNSIIPSLSKCLIDRYT